MSKLTLLAVVMTFFFAVTLAVPSAAEAKSCRADNSCQTDEGSEPASPALP